MKEISTISLERMNNGAHFLYVSNILARAEADPKVKTKAAAQVAALKAAKVLNQHIKDYAIDPKMQLDRETGLLLNLITDLEGKYKTEVETLSLTPFVTNLKAANERVRTLTASRTDEKTGITVGALKTSRKASDDACRMLVKMVNALALVEGETDYVPFIDYVNAEIVHYKREVLGQKAAAADTTGGETTPSGGDSESPDEI